jgi:hypothetical protein
MTNPQRAGINVDLTEAQPEIGTSKQGRSRLFLPALRHGSSFSACRDACTRLNRSASNHCRSHGTTMHLAPDAARGGARFHATIHVGSVVQQGAEHHIRNEPSWYSGKTLSVIGAAIGRERGLQDDETNPVGILGKICRFSGVAGHHGIIPVAKRRKEPVGILGNVCRLCGWGRHRGLIQDKRETKPFRLLRISRIARVAYVGGWCDGGAAAAVRVFDPTAGTD